MSGIFGVAAKKDCIQILFFGIDYHSHLGTEFGGMAVFGPDGFTRHIRSISQSQFKSKFYDDYSQIRGNMGIGAISDSEEQPIYLNSKFGPFCIVTNGIVRNKAELTKELLAKGASFSEVSAEAANTTELIAKLITEGSDIPDGIEKMSNKIEGSCSLLLLNKDGIYAARDKRGCSPLIIGRSSEAWAVTTETSAFPNTHFICEKDLGPGEIALLKSNGIVQKRPALKQNKICAFLWIYTGFPASTYEGINVEVVRERCGQLLAKKDADIDVDVVSGVPDSGLAHGLGYAIGSGKPFRRPLVKYTPGYGRSYTPPSQETRDMIAKMKLIPIKDIINGNKIVVCEDSIVRGTQLKNFAVKKLWDAGAEEVHVRVACPPLMFPCIYNLSTKSINELAARRAIRDLEGKDIDDVSEYMDTSSEKYKNMVDWITKNLEVTSIKYLTVDEVIEAIGLPKERLCLYCWRGGVLCQN